MHTSRHRRARNRGFGMVEVLIAFVVLAFGLLGIANLQLVAKRAGHQAWQRGLAVSYANDLIERVRVNPAGAADYHTGLGAAALGGASLDVPARDCNAVTCTPEQLAAWDLWRWEQSLDGAAILDADGNAVGGLIAPSACVVFAEAAASMPNTGRISVIVTWKSQVKTADAVTGAVCGAGAAGSDTSRRQIVVNTYVIDTRDLSS
jgi:type IV pilus assembly protein PilV